MAIKPISMQAVIETTEVNHDFSQLLHRVQNGKEYVVFKERGQNIAALIGDSLYEEFRLWYAKRLMQEMGEGMSAALAEEGVTTEEELAELMEEDRKAVFNQYYGDKK